MQVLLLKARQDTQDCDEGKGRQDKLVLSSEDYSLNCGMQVDRSRLKEGRHGTEDLDDLSTAATKSIVTRESLIQPVKSRIGT